jgi:hypothetical protein
VPAELSRLDLLLPAETTVTENISPRGARVVSRQQWQEGDRVFVKALKGDLRLRAQVVYCEILPSNTFALGLKLLTVPDWWERGVNGRATRGNKRTGKRRSKFQASVIRFPSVRGTLSPTRSVSSITLPPSALHW